MLRTGSQIEVAWPIEFPNGRLFKAADIAHTWQDVSLLGTRQEGHFTQPASPGFYRLAWLP
jgi:hypothetical protein